MEYIFSIAATVVAGMLGFCLQMVIKENLRLKREREEKDNSIQKAIQGGLQCILRDTLIHNHKKYMDLGYISLHGLQNWILMYDAYHALGGNGMIDHMKEEIEELPTK